MERKLAKGSTIYGCNVKAAWLCGRMQVTGLQLKSHDFTVSLKPLQYCTHMVAGRYVYAILSTCGGDRVFMPVIAWFLWTH